MVIAHQSPIVIDFESYLEITKYYENSLLTPTLSVLDVLYAVGMANARPYVGAT